MRPRTRIFRLAAAAGALGVVAVPSPASAASSVESRWWSASPLFAAPDVGADQLLVQGSPDAATPLAYAGLSFSLAADELPSKLVLQQAPDSASSPGSKLALCALEGPATSETAPGFDCTTKADGTAGADGDAATQARTPAPALGEHTDAALAAAGFSQDEIRTLRDAGVV